MTTELFGKKVVMIDFNNTLVRFARPMTHKAQLADHIGVPLADFEPVFKDFEEAFEVGMEPVERMSLMLERLDRRYDPMLIQELIDIEESACLEAMEPNPKVYWMLSQFKAGEHTTILVCNGNPNTISIYQDMGFAEHFDAAIFSCQVRVRKPGSYFYELAMRARPPGTGPADTVYIGDGGDSELPGVKAAYPQVTTILVNHLDRDLSDPQFAHDYMVPNVADVVELLVPRRALSSS